MSPDIWSAIDKANMRETAEAHMDDVGYRMVRSVTVDDVGDSIETWTQESESTICGLETHEGRENKGDISVTTFEMTIRFPYDYTIDQLDRFLVTKFRGETVNLLYEINTPVRLGISAKRAGVKKVEL